MNFDFKTERKEVRINGVEVVYYSDRAVKEHAKLLEGRYWEQEKKSYIKVNQHWYTYSRNWNGEDWRRLAGIETIDFAVPQQWFDKHYAEIKKRGGAAWLYDNNRTFGEPIFFDQIERMAMVNLKKFAPKGAAKITHVPAKRKK
jgi:hypothetical protein